MANKRLNNKSQAPVLLQAQGIAKLVSLAARHTPWESKCLVQGLTCRILLRGFKIPSTFYLGVAKHGSDLKAHAWISYEDYIILGGTTSPDDFKVITSFSDYI